MQLGPYQSGDSSGSSSPSSSAARKPKGGSLAGSSSTQLHAAAGSGAGAMQQAAGRLPGAARHDVLPPELFDEEFYKDFRCVCVPSYVSVLVLSV